MRIDAHHHLWPNDVITRQPWRPPEDDVLRREFGLAEFEAELDASGLDGSILMQSVDSLDENHRLATYAASSERVLGWVGFADLTHPEAGTEDVAALLASRTHVGGDKLVGIRCLVGADPMMWAHSERGREALGLAAASSLAWDAVPITDAQADAIAAVAHALPGLRIIIDHLASPPLREEGFASWHARLERLAVPDNVAIKLSVGVAVLQRWETWDAEALAPYVEAALEVFGPERSMMASNWPVVLLRASHADAWRSIRAATRHLSPSDRALVEGRTAAHWYGLEETK